jgi:hypothetical protein
MGFARSVSGQTGGGQFLGFSLPATRVYFALAWRMVPPLRGHLSLLLSPPAASG